MKQVNRRHQSRDTYPSNAESRSPPPSHFSQLPAIIPDCQHSLTNPAFGMNIIGENVMIAKSHPSHTYRNSFCNNKHIPTICRDIFLVGVTHTDSLREAEDREGWKGIVATLSVVPRRPPRLRDWDDEMRWHIHIRIIFCHWFTKISLMSFRLHVPFGRKYCERRYNAKSQK